LNRFCEPGESGEDDYVDKFTDEYEIFKKETDETGKGEDLGVVVKPKKEVKEVGKKFISLGRNMPMCMLQMLVCCCVFVIICDVKKYIYIYVYICMYV
jgi:hypothetical protein